MGGIFGRATYGQPLSLELCRAQTDSLAHRGPDSAGYFWDRADSGAYRLGTGQIKPDFPRKGDWDLFLGRLLVLSEWVIQVHWSHDHAGGKPFSLP